MMRAIYISALGLSIAIAFGCESSPTGELEALIISLGLHWQKCAVAGDADGEGPEDPRGEVERRG